MPEEKNRLIVDHLSDYLFCPTEKAVENLKKEGIAQGVYNVGDVMYDLLLHSLSLLEKQPEYTLEKVFLRLPVPTKIEAERNFRKESFINAKKEHRDYFGSGNAGQKIVEILAGLDK